jgi:hypothetical protein
VIGSRTLALPAVQWTNLFPRFVRRRCYTWAATALVLCVGLNGCAWTLITAADATGSVIQAGYAIASNYSSPTFVNGEPAAVSTVCIEVNQTVSVGDFVPALQLALNRRGVRSTVYNPGTSPASCEARLVYNASVDYGQREFSDTPTQYLAVIDLTLIQQGRVLITARYQTGELGLDRFSNASTKLNGMIDKMVVNRQDLRPQTIQTSQIN